MTGGIGSGKSTILSRLAELGATTIDADAVGREVLEPGTDAFRAVAARWPQVVVGDRIDRRALAAIVFTDPVSLEALESVTHPAIRSEIRRRVDEAGNGTVVIEVSVPDDIAGTGRDHTIVADLPTDARRRRLLERGMDPVDIERRMAVQPDREGWLERGSWVISTAGSRADVAARVDRLWEQMLPSGGSLGR